MIHLSSAIWTISFWYPPNFTGAGFQSHREHRKFNDQGIHTIVLSAGVSSARHMRGKTINLDNVEVKYLPVTPFPTWSFDAKFGRIRNLCFSLLANLSYLSFSLLSAWAIFLHGHRGDLVRVEGYDRYAVIPVIIARFKGIRTAMRMVLLGSDDPDSILQRARQGQKLEYINLACFHLVEKVVVICKAMSESCTKVKIPKRKITYIPYGVDIEKYSPPVQTEKGKIFQKLGLDETKRYILFVGSAIERKGIDVLISAFIQISKVVSDVELLIVGPNQFNQGPFFESSTLQAQVTAYKNQLKKANCSNLVHWIGEVDNVHEYMKVSDVFCFPTRQEGFGLVIIEAMASGLPVVVSFLNGVTTDIVSSDETGFIIHGHDFQGYVQAIMEILCNPGKANLIGEAARLHVIDAFNLDSTIQQWITLFSHAE